MNGWTSSLDQAMRLLRAGRAGDAAALFDRLVEQRPGDAEGWAGLGVALMALGRRADGHAALLKALEIKPSHLPARQNLGMAALQEGRFEEAEKHLGRVAEKQPKDPAVLAAHGIALSKRGQHVKAVARLRVALRLAPNDPRTVMNLALALVEKGDVGEAIPLLEDLARRMPDNPAVLFNLGVALTKARRPAPAIARYRAALRLAPDNADIRNNLGNLLSRNGHWGEAETMLAKAHELRPDDPFIVKNLGRTLVARGAIERARGVYETAQALVPDDPEPQIAIAQSYQYQGRFDDAARVLDRLDSRHPGLPETLCLRLDGDNGRGTPEQIGALRRFLDDPAVEPAIRARCGFALGAALLQAGQDDAAFAAYGAANALRKAEYAGEYDPAADAAFIATTTEVLPALTFPAPPSGERGPRPLFILGAPRSGTSLVEQMLSMHPGVTGGGELPALLELPSRLEDRLGAPYPHCLAALTQDDLEWARMAYLSALGEVDGATEATFVSDKMPDNVWHVALIALLFPDAPVILCRRNPMAVGLSIFFQDFSSYNPWAYDLTDIGRRLRATNALTDLWQAAPLPRPMLEVDYEALTDAPEAAARAMLDFLGLEWSPAVLAFGGNRRAVRTASYWQVRQPLYKTSVALWKRFEDHLEPLRAGLDGRTS